MFAYAYSLMIMLLTFR